MIRLALDDLERTIDLLEQHYARKVMGQRDRSKAHALVGSLLHFIGKSVRSSYNEGDMRDPVNGVIFDQLRQLLT